MNPIGSDLLDTGVSLTHQGTSATRVSTKYSREEISTFAESLADIHPEKR